MINVTFAVFDKRFRKSINVASPLWLATDQLTFVLARRCVRWKAVFEGVAAEKKTKCGRKQYKTSPAARLRRNCVQTGAFDHRRVPARVFQCCSLDRADGNPLKNVLEIVFLLFLLTFTVFCRLGDPVGIHPVGSVLDTVKDAL